MTEPIRGFGKTLPRRRVGGTGDRTGEAPLPQVWASDEERLQVVERLGEHAGVGRLTLAEMEERVALACAAATRAELAD
jgi:hypothetical protein